MCTATHELCQKLVKLQKLYGCRRWYSCGLDGEAGKAAGLTRMQKLLHLSCTCRIHVILHVRTAFVFFGGVLADPPGGLAPPACHQSAPPKVPTKGAGKVDGGNRLKGGRQGPRSEEHKRGKASPERGPKSVPTKWPSNEAHGRQKGVPTKSPTKSPRVVPTKSPTKSPTKCFVRGFPKNTAT